jgi:hypothetical protein
MDVPKKLNAISEVLTGIYKSDILHQKLDPGHF